MSSDIRFLITAGINQGASVSEINTSIKQLQKVVNRKQLNLKINIDQNALKQIEMFNTRMKAVGDQALNTRKVVEEALLPSGVKVARTHYEGIGGAFEEIEKKARGTVGAMSQTSQSVREASRDAKQFADQSIQLDKQRERALQEEQKIRYNLNKQQQAERERNLRYEQATRQAIQQRSQQEANARERNLRYEQQTRRLVEEAARKEREKTAELQRQLALYQRQAQVNVQNIRRTHGTTVDDAGLRAYQSQVRALSTSTPNLQNAMRSLNMQFTELSANAKTAAGALEQSGMGVTEMMRTALVKFPIWMASATIFYQPIRIGRELVETLIDINTQMTTLSRVTGGEADIEKTLQNSFEIADRLGNRLEEVNEAIIGFARQGFRDDELTSMAEMATLMSNVSTMSLEESMSKLTAATKVFNIEATESMRVVDALNEVDL
ncbi:phage tail tape measure protein [Alkalihalophilus pseudofirmus]|uniref:phage tail tape measure protein n=1 Tax=Alkalihalophilus pseudofirmus TaxID=79885 RepID=UPI00259B86B9|nr:phage tail tape measure protein [Alkalihalophilus pseudofirmus]WEG18489.1 phage tail tape measure protein [Alkalihalophilus pseudofirmus]